MARISQRHPANVSGAWYVDTRCIDCDVCRQLAPGLIERVDGQSVLRLQPASEQHELALWRAAVACPTRSIGRQPSTPKPAGLFPLELDDGVFLTGYASVDSFGANAFLALRPTGNLLVDGPRWARPLVRALEDLGGVAHVLLTHRDDVADADRYADHFGARVWIHEDDADAAPFATDLLRGADPTVVHTGLLAVPVPGHTRGSVCYLLDDRFLFTGDSLFWSRRRADLAAHRDHTWYSWTVQADSLERLAREHTFEWVLAGHGDRARRPAGEMHERLVALVARMRHA